jgi:hypothetical protein
MNPQTSLIINNGRIVESQQIERTGSNKSGKIIKTSDWDENKQAKPVKTTCRYDSYSNLPSEGIFYEVTGVKIAGYEGRLVQKAKSSRFVREEFTYKNGQPAYVWTPYRKQFQLFRPNGKLWMQISAKLRHPCKRSKNLLDKINTALADITENISSWSDQPNYEIKLFNEKGEVTGYGKFENNQRVGIWHHAEKKYYFMMGVQVSKRTYYAGPDELDPREVLKTENSQLRAALMKRIGPKRLLEKLPFKTCDVHAGNRLLKADIKEIFGQDNLPPRLTDEQIAIAVLKCTSTGQLYYLRVPPMLKRVEHARQWLCGIDIQRIEEEYIRDRYSPERGLNASRQQIMENELRQAKHREKLVFAAEA